MYCDVGPNGATEAHGLLALLALLALLELLELEELRAFLNGFLTLLALLNKCIILLELK